MSEHGRGRQANRETVQRLVDDLVQRPRVKVTREEWDGERWKPGRAEWTTLPSLWEQLCASTQWQSGGPVSGGAFGSRPVIATGIVSVRAEIELFAVKGADEVTNPSPGMKLAQREQAAADAEWRAGQRMAEYRMVLGYAVPENASEQDMADYAAELADAREQAEAAVQELAAAADQVDNAKPRLVVDSLRAVAANITDQLDLEWWRDNLSGWISEIRAALALLPVYPTGVRGKPCPECKATNATTPLDGEDVRVPALGISWGAVQHQDQDDAAPPDMQVRAIECRVCHATWWRGASLDELALTMLTADERKLA